MPLPGPIAGVHLCGRPGHSGQFRAVTGGLLPGAGIREFRDAVHHRPGRADAETAGPQAHTAQMRAASKFSSAILNDPGLHIHPHD